MVTVIRCSFYSARSCSPLQRYEKEFGFPWVWRFSPGAGIWWDSNEYFWFLVYGVAVLILEEVSWYPGEEAVSCYEHPRVMGECASPEKFAAIIWFIYLHKK